MIFIVAVYGTFDTMGKVGVKLHPSNLLMGCMVARMAMNTTWECAKIDSESYDEKEPTLNRE